MNPTTSAPSPGERLPGGFIVIGAAAGPMFHLIHVLRLHGRVPVLQLGLVHPIDDSIVQRLLGRCERVVVLEPRPGAIETGVLGVCEAMRSRGEQPAVVWSRTLPPDPAGTAQVMRPDEALHPSALAAKIVHLLRTIRPGLVVASPAVSNLLLPGRRLTRGLQRQQSRRPWPSTGSSRPGQQGESCAWKRGHINDFFPKDSRPCSRRRGMTVRGSL